MYMYCSEYFASNETYCKTKTSSKFCEVYDIPLIEYTVSNNIVSGYRSTCTHSELNFKSHDLLTRFLSLSVPREDLG
jgi:hypothetical protein